MVSKERYKMRLLLLEDDEILNEILTDHLRDKGFNVVSSFNGIEAYDNIIHSTFDILILDVNVPQLSGFELLELLKNQHISIPSLFITSLNSSYDVKKGFDIGADDYLKKPFELVEFDARLEHIIKNYSLKNDTDFGLESDTLSIIIDNSRKKVSKKEFEILSYFIKHSNRTVSSEELISNIWLDSKIPTDSTVRTYIKNLRLIIGKDKIKSIRGVGYRFIKE